MPRPKGFMHSEETKRKISRALKGYSVSKETKQRIGKKLKGRAVWNKGKCRSEKVREKISRTLKERGIEPIEKFVGHNENNPNWRGGITSENRKIRGRVGYRLWREAVFARDNWTCQKMGVQGGKLHPHHIKNFAQYPELRFAIDNGITLGIEYHKEFHKKYGRENNTKEQLEEFLGGVC